MWLLILTAALALPPLLRGLRRRGTGVRHERSFLIQRAPQLATGLALSLAMVSFEAIEFSLGTGEPAFGRRLFERYVAFLPVASLALVLPGAWAAAVSWLGVAWSAAGSVLLVSGLYALRESFSTDSELLPDQELHRQGPYRFVLHPIYAGWVHYLLGSALTSLSPVVAVLVVVLVAPLYLGRARYEEALLRERFGRSFDEFAESRSWRRLL
jgi:protein-S-isoprenylcysteine O-methyltransferase Ste14